MGIDRSGVGAGRYQSFDQVSNVGRAFEPVWNARTKRAIPKLGAKVSLGDSASFKREGRKGGYLLSFTYEYEEVVRSGFNRQYNFDENGQSTVPREDFDFKKGSQEVLWGAFGSGFVEFDPDNTLNLTSFFSRTAEDETLVKFGGAEGNISFAPQTQTSLDFIGRTMFFNQLQGDHRNLGKTNLRLRWNGVAALGKRDQPDRRFVQQFVETQRIPTATRSNFDLNQISTGGTTHLRFPLWKAFDGTAYGTVGFDAGFEKRDFLARRFIIAPYTGQSIPVGDPEAVFGPEGLGTLTLLNEITTRNDGYRADNTLLGGFVQLETPMTSWLKFQGLLRMEVFHQRVENEDPFAEDPARGPPPPDFVRQNTDRRDVDPMPSANFAFTINPEMFVKIGYGMTVIRPAIRELAPYPYIDFLRGWFTIGNPELQRSRIQNVEARYEYYFGESNLVSATAFYKNFKDPIEFVITSPVNRTATFENADKAWLVGGEIELRLGFGTFSEKLDRFYFLGNVAFMKSKTTLSADAAGSGRTERPLFNQSPYVTNLSLRFDDPDAGVMVGLIYNAFGRRIVEVGGAAADIIFPDVYEKQQHLLDLIVTWKPAAHVKLGFKWKNIAFAKKQYEQGNQLVLREDRGTSFSIGAEYIY